MKNLKKTTLNKIRFDKYPEFHNAMYNLLSEAGISKEIGSNIMELSAKIFKETISTAYNAGYEIGHRDGIRNERGLTDEVNSLIKANE